MTTKRRKPVELLRVPFNCFIAPVTKELITGIQNGTKESQGEVVDRAISLLALGEEVSPRIPKGPAVAKPSNTITRTAELIKDLRRSSHRPLREKGDKTR